MQNISIKMHSGEEGSWPPGEKSGTKPVASQDSPQEQITETPQAQVTFDPPQMSSGASALQTEESADEKADTMKKHGKLDHNADDNPVIKEKDSTFNQNQDDAQNEISKTDVGSMISADMTEEKIKPIKTHSPSNWNLTQKSFLLLKFPTSWNETRLYR